MADGHGRVGGNPLGAKVPELKFLRNEAGEGEGLSDAGIETYRADPYPAVARETSQNSRDAHDKSGAPGHSVLVEVERITVPASSLPGVERFKEVVSLCLALAVAKKRKKETEFFRQAEHVLSQGMIPVLRIADYNTTGLRGPCEEGTPFHSLVKSSGVSNKDDETSSGSFGIGKSAVYSASDLQTVFYSTSYESHPGSRQFLCQGKTKFMSFVDAEGAPFRSIGYWGEPNGYLPIQDLSLVPDWLKRDRTGTTVCSVAVRESDNWQNEMLASLLINFFSAVHTNEIRFAVQGRSLTDQTLRQCFDDTAIATALKTKQDDYAFARSMYDCLASEDATQHSLQIPAAGTFKLRLVVQDGLPKRVGILRNGMYICDSLGHFGDKFSRFPMYRDFVAIVEPADDMANAWLRRMENPRHDEFSPERLLTPSDRRVAAASGRQLASMIREKIKDAAKPLAKDETDLEELSEFFAAELSGPRDEIGARDVESFKLVKSQPRAKRETKAKPRDAGVAEGGGAPGDGHEGSGVGQGPEPGLGSGGTGTRARKEPLVLLEPRTFMLDPNDATRRRVLFTPTESGEAVLEFQSSGLSYPQRLQTVPSEFRVLCTEGRRQDVEVRFSEPYAGPVEIVSLKVEEGTGEA